MLSEERRGAMGVEVIEQVGGRIMEVQVSGKLTHEDYRQLSPLFDQRVREQGKIRVLFEMLDFHGWEVAAVWDDIKLDLKHFAHIERLAMVGDKRWEKGMSVFCRPFTTAQIRYFDRAEIDAARIWLAAN